MIVRCRASILVSGMCVLLAACNSSESMLPNVKVENADTEFRVAARGELIASESLPIALPGSIRMAFNIAWIAPEFSEISAGDVIARFDDVQIRLDKEETSLNVAKSEFKLADTERSGELERTRIDHESLRVDGERDLSETFANVDPRLFSRNEIIDALSDLEYLDVEAAFLDWQFDTFDQRTAAEKNLIRAEQQGELTKLEKQQAALGMMELRSPADGTFVYARTPWGEKLGKGKTVYPGRPIGLLPVRGKVKARLFVPESDAVGLQAGQLVRFRLDSATDREFTARVDTVSPVASPRTRTDPQKFFSVDAIVEDVDADLMRVGSRLRGGIITGDIIDGIVLPAQTVYGDADKAYVYVADGGDSERRAVQLGQRSPDLVEIRSGVKAGERVSLVRPAESGE